jgi:MFS transporter, SP family, inositol transporter
MSSTAVSRTGPRPWYVAAVSGMASYIDATAIVSSGIALVIYQNSIGITGDEIGVLSATLTLAIAFGAIVGGRLGDRFGRRPVFVVTMAFIVLGATLLVLAPGFALLFVGMALVGFGTGADLPVSLATIAEFATDQNRGKLISFSQVLWIMGIVAAIALATIVGGLGQLGGQILFAHVGVVAAIVLALRLTVPESPVWLVSRDERSRGLRTERAERARIADLFKKEYVVPFVALLVFYPLVNLGANTAGQFNAYLWVNAAGSTVQFSSMIGLILLPVGLAINLAYIRIVDTRLRMPIFYVGAVAYIASLVVPALLGVSVPTLLAWQVLGIIGGAFAFEAIMKVWTQESFPTLLRATAQGTIIAVARVLAAALALVTPLLIANGPQVLFGVLTVVMIIGMAAAIWGFRNATRNEFDVEDQVVETVAA